METSEISPIVALMTDRMITCEARSKQIKFPTVAFQNNFRQ